jgi:hypothetical protein
MQRNEQEAVAARGLRVHWSTFTVAARVARVVAPLRMTIRNIPYPVSNPTYELAS